MTEKYRMQIREVVYTPTGPVLIGKDEDLKHVAIEDLPKFDNCNFVIRSDSAETIASGVCVGIDISRRCYGDYRDVFVGIAKDSVLPRKRDMVGSAVEFFLVES